MPKRRLRLAREVLAPLPPAELASVAGAAPLSLPDPICYYVELNVVSVHSNCHTCGFGCTADC